MIFFYEKDSRFNPQLIHKSRFLNGQVPIDKIWVEYFVFAIQHIENRKILLRCFPPRDQTNPFA